MYNLGSLLLRSSFCGGLWRIVGYSYPYDAQLSWGNLYLLLLLFLLSTLVALVVRFMRGVIADYCQKTPIDP